jgi:hypothetical protein
LRHATVVVALLIGAWWFTSSDAVGDWAGRPNSAAQVGMGESMYVGYAGLADRRVVATSLTPIATSGLQTAVFFCEPTDTRTEIVGIVDHGSINDYCDLVPVSGRTRLGADHLEGYLVIEVTRTEPGVQRLCGIDVRFRDGWRWGHARAAVYDVVFEAGDGALEGGFVPPSCSGR